MNDARIPLIDLAAQQSALSEAIEAQIKDVLASGQFILGPKGAELERAIADYVGVKDAVAVGSGTDALLLTLRAMGVGPGDEVIVPAFTFFASVEVVLQLGARPVLVDIDPRTYCMDVDAVKDGLSDRTKAIMPVHLFGQPCDMDPLLEIADQHGVQIVEDNAQALGASYRGRKTGGLGDAGCLSFYPTKNLGAYGDGGMILTNDEALAEQLRMLRTHGWRRKYHPELVGYNSRLDELQAAILLAKLPHLDRWNDARRKWASVYDERLAEAGIGLPFEHENVHGISHLYVVSVAQRERVIRELDAAGVATGVYYPRALHQVEACADLGYRDGDFPVSERAAERCLAIPLYPEMTEEQVQRVSQALIDACGRLHE